MAYIQEKLQSEQAFLAITIDPITSVYAKPCDVCLIVLTKENVYYRLSISPIAVFNRPKRMICMVAHVYFFD
jgi:hypothetical protein